MPWPRPRGLLARGTTCHRNCCARPTAPSRPQKAVAYAVGPGEEERRLPDIPECRDRLGPQRAARTYFWDQEILDAAAAQIHKILRYGHESWRTPPGFPAPPASRSPGAISPMRSLPMPRRTTSIRSSVGSRNKRGAARLLLGRSRAASRPGPGAPYNRSLSGRPGSDRSARRARPMDFRYDIAALCAVFAVALWLIYRRDRSAQEGQPRHLFRRLPVLVRGLPRCAGRHRLSHPRRHDYRGHESGSNRSSTTWRYASCRHCG